MTLRAMAKPPRAICAPSGMLPTTSAAVLILPATRKAYPPMRPLLPGPLFGMAI